MVPKAVPYGCSESYDYRVAYAIAHKNIGEQYVEDIGEQDVLKYELKAKTLEFKLNRHVLQKNRAQLKKKREAIEGQTYESNIGLF